MTIVSDKFWVETCFFLFLDLTRLSLPKQRSPTDNPDTWSQLVLDDTFDPSSEEAQVFLLQFCTDFFGQAFASPVNTSFACPIQAFDLWLQEQSNATSPEDIYIHNCGGASGVPVSQEQFDPCIISWAQTVGERFILSRNHRVQIIFFPFESRIRYKDPYHVLSKEWHLIEDWMKATNDHQAPEGVNKGYFSSGDFWWYDTNGQMLRTAYSSAAITLAASAVVVLFSSRSIVVTIFATLTIGFVLTSVTAILIAMGWTLGFLESICLAILIGVSVDFVIHFSHSYSALPGDVHRSVRTKYALIQMGPSILATAVTTIAAAIVMLFAVITFFRKFALVLFFTILQAIVASFVMFLTWTDCMGPSNPTHVVDSCTTRLVMSLRRHHNNNITWNHGMRIRHEKRPSEVKPKEDGNE